MRSRRDWRAAVATLADVQSLYVVGRGAGYAAAQEAALKLKETCGLHAEAMSAAEIMHGPWTLAGADFPVVMFSQNDEALTSLSELAASLTARGVTLLAAGPVKADGAMRLSAADGLHPSPSPSRWCRASIRLPRRSPVPAGAIPTIPRICSR